MKSPLSNIRSVLGTIRPVDGVVGLRCDVTTAEEIWFEWVSLNDRKDFELVVESAPHGCNVFVRPWSEQENSVVRTVCFCILFAILGSVFITLTLREVIYYV